MNRIRWDEERVLRCSVEDKLPSELTQSEQGQGETPTNRWEALKSNFKTLLTGKETPPGVGA